MKYEQYKPKIEIASIPPLTVDEEAFMVREGKYEQWKRMTRQQVEEIYPGALDNFDTRSSLVKEFYLNREVTDGKDTSKST